MQTLKTKEKCTTGWIEIEISEISDLSAITIRRMDGGFFSSDYDTLQLLDRDNSTKSVSYPRIIVDKIKWKNDDHLPVRARLEEKNRFHVSPLELGGGSNWDSSVMTLTISGPTEKINQAKQSLFAQGYAIFN